ncbi:MAG TPA: glycosyl hydrolase [Trebonia sp.]|nr:glycosyl hydrolase [Trebonia sp.]
MRARPRPRAGRAVLGATALLASGALAAGCAATSASSSPAGAAPRPSTAPATKPPATKPPATKPAGSTRAGGAVPLGVWEPSSATTWSGIAAFGQQAGQPVRYALTFLKQGDPFPQRLGQEAAANHAELIVQLEPSAKMARVVAGGDDAYLDELAAQVHAYGHPVIISWAAEANGNWYSWGFTKTPPAEYRAAWAHVMARFRAAGDGNVTWMATINRTYEGAGPTSDYIIPGVDMYGVDAYYSYPGDTFARVFGTTLAQIRSALKKAEPTEAGPTKAGTDKPILVSETGIGPVAGQAKSIPGLVRGVVSNGLAGVVYFNQSQNQGVYHQNWTLATAGMSALRASLQAARSPASLEKRRRGHR